MKIEVAYATAQRQLIVQIEVEPGTNIIDAVLRSDIREAFDLPAIEDLTLGVFGRKVVQPENYILQAGDRVEIYRPLMIDPMQARRARAAKRASEG